MPLSSRLFPATVTVSGKFTRAMVPAVAAAASSSRHRAARILRIGYMDENARRSVEPIIMREMAQPSPPLLIALLGPTGGGKSELAAELAVRLGGEVVNCDAFQMYAGL